MLLATSWHSRPNRTATELWAPLSSSVYLAWLQRLLAGASCLCVAPAFRGICNHFTSAVASRRKGLAGIGTGKSVLRAPDSGGRQTLTHCDDSRTLDGASYRDWNPSTMTWPVARLTSGRVNRSATEHIGVRLSRLFTACLYVKSLQLCLLVLFGTFSVVGPMTSFSALPDQL